MSPAAAGVLVDTLLAAIVIGSAVILLVAGAGRLVDRRSRRLKAKAARLELELLEEVYRSPAAEREP